MKPLFKSILWFWRVVLFPALRWLWQGWFLRTFYRRYWYRNIYLKSDHWRRFRKQVLNFYGETCQQKECLVRQPLQVHHLHYKNVGREHVTDVRLLCPYHHELVETGVSLKLKDGDVLPGYQKYYGKG